MWSLAPESRIISCEMSVNVSVEVWAQIAVDVGRGASTEASIPTAGRSSVSDLMDLVTLVDAVVDGLLC